MQRYFVGSTKAAPLLCISSLFLSGMLSVSLVKQILTTVMNRSVAASVDVTEDGVVIEAAPSKKLCKTQAKRKAPGKAKVPANSAKGGSKDLSVMALN